MPTDLTNDQIDFILERFDQTEPALQRRIVARFIQDRSALAVAMIESVKLQTHYAQLLNQYDGGDRTRFEDPQDWLDRMAELDKIPPTQLGDH